VPAARGSRRLPDNYRLSSRAQARGRRRGRPLEMRSGGRREPALLPYWSSGGRARPARHQHDSRQSARIVSAERWHNFMPPPGQINARHRASVDNRRLASPVPYRSLSIGEPGRGGRGFRGSCCATREARNLEGAFRALSSLLLRRRRRLPRLERHRTVAALVVALFFAPLSLWGGATALHRTARGAQQDHSTCAARQRPVSSSAQGARRRSVIKFARNRIQDLSQSRFQIDELCNARRRAD
jgi:hypothetical protein